MATDFNYNNKTIDSSGPIKPSGTDQPGDPRTRVDFYSDIESIPNPYIGMIVTVKMDETNQNKMTDYKVISLKPNALGIANSVIDQVQRYVDYLGVSTGGSVDLSGYATKDELNSKANTSDIPTNTSELYNDSGFLTSIPSEYVTETEMNEAIANVSSGGSISQEEINTAVNNYLTEHPVSSGATAEQAAQIETNKNDIADIINNKLDGKTFKFLTQAEYDALSESEKNNEIIEYHITDAIENSHTHTNKEVLDKMSEDIDGSLLFNGNKITSDATENSHTHTNKEVLDKISEDTDGSLLFNGNKINSDSTSGGITTVEYENLSTELQSLFVVIK